MKLYDELVARGLIAQVTNEEEISKMINEGRAVFYIGFDPTADSLHVGHFMALCLMKRLQMAGNRPIALIGGGVWYAASQKPEPKEPTPIEQTEKQEQQEQKVPATDNPSSSTEDTSGETLVPVDAPADVKTRLISVNIRKDKDDLTQYTAKDGTVKEKHYGKIGGDNVIDLENGQIRNCTKLPSELIGAEAEKKPSVTLSDSNEPQVLIIHTHTTESYERDSDGYYDTDYDGRSLCPANSVVGVGAVLAQTLADNGISTLHDGTVFDDPVYNYSYSRSRERTEQLLKEYPSIKIVLDIHRDGIADGDVRIAPVAEINGRKAAQIMIICGCDDGTDILPDYMDNLRFASYLQNAIEKDNKGITRPMLFDYRFYNQDLAEASLVIEFGALANDIEQVRYSAELAGRSIANLLKNAD